MDTGDSDKLLEKFNEEFEKLKADKNVTLCNFDEIIPISAKFSNKSVEFLKWRLRHWLDVHHSQTTQANVENLQNSLQTLKVQSNIQ